MSRVSSLHRLQELDQALDKNRERVEEILRILEDDSKIVHLKQALREVEDILQKARASHSKADHIVASQRAKIEQTERTLYSGTVRNPKELQDRQQEAESLKRYLVTLEDRLLDAMIELEEAEARHDAASNELSQAEGTRAAEHQDLTSEKERLLADISRKEAEREAALTDVDVEDLELYNTLRARFAGRVVSVEQDGNCSACGVELARSLLQELRTGDDLIRCRQCGRVLYAG
ncbi:MAG: hypothetical protein GTO14_18285 [Anaerolineales bacterium]|nr:hypothetical protein [Anaerolineales bacterium]